MKWVTEANDVIELYLQNNNESYFRHSSGAEFVYIGEEGLADLIKDFDSGNFSEMDATVEDYLRFNRDINEDELIDIQSYWPVEQKIKMDFVIASVPKNEYELIISEKFKVLCLKIFEELGGKTEAYIDWGYPSSFITVRFNIKNEKYLLQCNYNTNHLAFAKNDFQSLVHNAQIDWIDLPEAATAFNVHFKVLSAAKLKEKTIIIGNERSGYYLENDFYYTNCPAMLNGLSYDLGYWKPETIAEVVFNWFD